MTTILASFTNSDDGITSFVVDSHLGGYAVTMRDDDSGEFVPFSTHGIKSLDDAIAKAKQAVA